MCRLRFVAAVILIVVFAAHGSTNAAAEDWRVFTVLHDLNAVDEGQRPPVISRSVTLFHADKVYDYIDVADEVIVFEPTQRQFRVLNRAAGLTATVAFDEIKHYLKVAYDETERHAATLSSESKNSDGEMLLMQLSPRFEETFNEGEGLLMLDGGSIRYSARTVSTDRPGVAESYFRYADWMCRLNYLLHPGPMLPEPRLALNASLKSRDRLPKSVELFVGGSPGRHLRADHTIDFDLNTQERSWIHQWESQLKTARQIPLREYQQEFQKAMVTSR